MPEEDISEDLEPCELSHPTSFQKRTLWTAITAVSLVIISSIAVGVIILGGQVLGFLQPLLVPIAVAAIVAYLLQPIIIWLRVKTRIKYQAAMLIVYVAFVVGIALLAVSVILPSLGQAQKIVEDWETIQYKITDISKHALDSIQNQFDHPAVQKYSREYYDKGVEWVSEEGPRVAKDAGKYASKKLTGVLGFVGYLFGLILVPLYLFFFLKESHRIKKSWSNYLPLRASRFKDELVDTLQEVNQYLISFFRGQMVVSLIDGALVAITLALVLKLPYALLIGVFLAILGLIPYIGNLMVMIPAIIIAVVHFADKDWVVIDVDSPIKAGEVHIISLDGELGKKKYISDVETFTRVKAKFTSSEKELVEAFVPYQKSEDSDEIINETLIGEVMDVTLANGVVKRGAIVEVIGLEKKAAVLKNAWSFLPHIWVYPLIVLAIFLILQQINGLVTAPMIVGDSVGLHPFTVIFSVLFWSFLLGGLLGALLAVPLTASLKVLFRRYIWNSRIEPRVGPLGEPETIQINESTKDKKP